MLDGTIVSMSIAEMVFAAIFASDKIGLSFLRMLRILRVLRVLRLMRSWRGLYTIIKTFLRAVPQMVNIMILILLCMFMFSLLGMQLFGGIFTAENGYSSEHCPGEVCEGDLHEKPPFHFDYCAPAMITIFILLTGEWVEAMEPVASLLGPWTSAFFILVVLIGKFMLMNLLVAVILHEFADESGSPRGSPRKSTASPTMDTSRNTRLSATETSRFEPAQFVETPPRWPDDYSILILGPQNRFRKLCAQLVQHPWFDRIIIIAIMCSSIGLALDSPRNDPKSSQAILLNQADILFTGIFFCEMCIKVSAFGFACGKGTYLSSAWNQVDFAIVMVSILVLIAERVPQLQALRVLRTLRVLRPLRLVSRNAGMRLIITSLFKSMAAVVNVFGVVITLQIVFAIIGMQLFSGTMARCSEPDILTRDACISGPEGEPGSGTGYVTTRWANDPIGSFDDFGSAMRLLYVMSSGDQWEVPMYVMMGARAPGQAPGRNDFSLYALFPIIWMLVGYIFAINLFVGVVVDNFSRMQQEENGSATMTLQQQQWASTMQASMMMIPSKATRPPSGPIRRRIYQLVTSPPFDGFITFVIVANIAVMSCDYYGIEDEPTTMLAYQRAMVTFNVFYYAECVLKISGLGPTGYFGDLWCCFDFFLVCTSLVDEFAEELLAQILPMPPMLLRVLRIFRILRILRLLRHAKGLRDLIVTMILSFPSLLNVGSLLALIIFIYAVLGRQLFTFLAYRTQEAGGALHGGINNMRNFETFGSSFLLLFQCLTGDGWSTIMADSMIDELTGICSEAEGNCGSVAAVPFFITFQIIGCFVFVNLIVAVILENFATLHNINPELGSSSDLELFKEAWTELDPDATNFIPLEALPALLLKLPRPLGLKGKSELRAKQLCMRLRLSPSAEGIEFRTVLLELIDNNYFRSAYELDEDDFYGLVPKLKMPINSPTGRYTPPADQDQGSTVAGFFAIKALLQEHVKGKLMAMLHRAQERLAARGGRRAPARAKGQGQAPSPGKISSPGKPGTPNQKIAGKKAFGQSKKLPAPAPITCLRSGSMLSEAVDGSVASCNGRVVSKAANDPCPSAFPGRENGQHAASNRKGAGLSGCGKPAQKGSAQNPASPSKLEAGARSPVTRSETAMNNGGDSRRMAPPDTYTDRGNRINIERPKHGNGPSGYSGYAQNQQLHDKRHLSKYLDGQRFVKREPGSSGHSRLSEAPSSIARTNGRTARSKPVARAQQAIVSTAELDRLAYGSESAAMAASGHFTSLNDPRNFGFPSCLEERNPLDFASSLLQNGRYALPSDSGGGAYTA